METNVKVVGFANRSINGVDIDNRGFDLEYDGRMLNLTGFSGDKLYYAKLNNQQIMNLLQMPASKMPLEQRIMYYNQPKIRKGTPYPRNSIKLIKIPRISSHKSRTYRRSHKPASISSYKSPKLRSEYKRSGTSSSSKKRKTHKSRSK